MMELLYISERARTAPLISPTASSIAAIIPLSDRDIDAHSPSQSRTCAEKTVALTALAAEGGRQLWEAAEVLGRALVGRVVILECHVEEEGGRGVVVLHDLARDAPCPPTHGRAESSNREKHHDPDMNLGTAWPKIVGGSLKLHSPYISAEKTLLKPYPPASFAMREELYRSFTGTPLVWLTCEDRLSCELAPSM